MIMDGVRRAHQQAGGERRLARHPALRFRAVLRRAREPVVARSGCATVVVEGKMQGGNFRADQLLVKHSEEYTLEEGHQKQKEDYYKSILNQ